MNGMSADGYLTDQDCLTEYSYRCIQASINGCGPLAVFNILHALGRDLPFEQILQEMDALHRMHRPGPTTMRVMRLMLASCLPELREHSGRAEALRAACGAELGILRYSEERVPHFVSFVRQGELFRFFNVRDGQEDFTASMEDFFAGHVGTMQYVSVFTA